MDHLVQASVIHGRQEEAAVKIAAPELDGPQQAPSRASELIQKSAHGSTADDAHRSPHGDRETIKEIRIINLDRGGPSHGSVPSLGRALVVLQQATKALDAVDLGSRCRPMPTLLDDPVAETLVRSLELVVLGVLTDGSTE